MGRAASAHVRVLLCDGMPPEHTGMGCVLSVNPITPLCRSSTMFGCYYLLVWCEDSQQWWQADECEERSLRRATSLLHGRNPRLVLNGRHWAVVRSTRSLMRP